MDLIVYLNGNFVRANEAKISIYDHGFLYGEGVFETLRVYKGKVFRFQRHIQRLYDSLKQIHMDLPIGANIIHKTIGFLLHQNRLKDAYVRVTISRGEGPIGLDSSLCSQPTILIIAEPMKSYPSNFYSEGISLMISSHRKIPPDCISPTIKSSNYLMNILAKREAKDKGAQEAILLNIEGYLTEGTVSNLFIVKDRKIYTPALSSGILNGITREAVIELAEHRHSEVVQTHIDPHILMTADESFITNTTMEIMPVAYCDGTKIGDNVPGKITKALIKDYKKLIEKETRE